ncbi:MAG: hypothetical protein DME80_06750 [Verrucomicrobia bacterium]|nr:MAG: hypothetical protein DME80_06750 [Verrucomicrobiota bacterium]
MCLWEYVRFRNYVPKGIVREKALIEEVKECVAQACWSPARTARTARLMFRRSIAPRITISTLI